MDPTDYSTPKKATVAKVVSPAKDPLDKAITEKAGLSGLAFLALKSSRNNLYVFPSTKNYVGNIQFKDAIADSGCGSMLLKIQDTDMLDRIFSEFSDIDKYWMVLKRSIGTVGVGRALVVKHSDERLRFKVAIGVDLFGDDHTCDSKIIRFHLSSAHAAHICDNSTYMAHFTEEEQMQLKELCDLKIPAVSVSLVGNLITSQYAEIRYFGVSYFLDASACPAVKWAHLRGISSTIYNMLDKETKQMMDMLEYDFNEFGNDEEDLMYDL